LSSTQMDFSPIEIDRKQDITSWPEGDITRLTTRDQNRYQKRKSAIIEYFQSELSAEEISSRHQLASTDSLETLARRCLMLHEDGQPWGLRALVPGVRVVDQRVPVESGTAEVREVASAEAEEDEDTGEREAIRLTNGPSLPQTPLPATIESEREDTEHAVEVAEEVTQGDSPAAEALEEVEQADFPSAEVVEEVEQEDFPVVESEDAEFEELTTKLEEQAEVEDVPAASEEVEQKDFPANEKVVEETEEVEQEDFPTGEDVVKDAEEPESLEQAPEATSEPELGEPVAEEESQMPELADEPGESEEESHTQKLITDANAAPGEAVTEPENEAEEETDPEVIDAQAESDELDTVEVAKIKAEERRERVASVETIKVPTALLEALEEADRSATFAEAETVETSVVGAQTRANSPTEDGVELVAAEQDSTIVGMVDSALVEEMDVVPTPEQRRHSRQLSLAKPLKTLTQSLAEDSRYRVTGSQAAIKRAVFRRWGKQDRQSKHRRWVRIVSAAVIASLLVVLAIPLCVGLMGYNTYTNIKGVASDGMNNLLAIKSLIPANKSDITSVLNTQKLGQAQAELSKAQNDFLQLQDMVNRPDIQSLLQQWAPEYSGELDMARHLVQVALDASRMGQELVGVAQLGANVVHGGSLLSSGSTKPLLTADDISAVEAALVHAQYYIGDIQTQMSQVNLAKLPFGSASQKAQLSKYLPLLPQAQSMISQVQGLVGPVSWLLGVGTPRNFLIQTLDRGELRPSGGFEGQYGVLSLSNGRLAPLTLKDVTQIDYNANGAEFGATPPPGYNWANFGYFGVRDANLSADYPTTAQIVMHYFQQEGGGPLDGDIQITPVVIAQFLQLTGPIDMTDYHVTVTAQNLETEIHLFQQNYSYIAREQQVTGTNTHDTRKAFTSELGQDVLARAKKLSTTQLMDFGKILFKDLKTRDLQVYFTNPVAEQWLQQNDDSGAMPQFTNGTDGFMVVQSNISISKAAQFVQSTFNDQVSLNANGDATHNLTVTLNYQRGNNPVYGYNTYADYFRLYVPGNAQLISDTGFNTGATLCAPTGQAPPKTNPPGTPPGPGTGNGNSNGTGTGTPTDPNGSYVDNINGLNKVVYGCGAYYHYYPDSYDRSCPNGNYELGYDGMLGKPWAVQTLGGASSTSSDLPGYKMWGGMTLTPMNCISTLRFQWITPHVVQNTPGQPPYQMAVGHQAGWPDNVQVNIDASALKGVANLSYNQSINVDTVVALPVIPLPPAPKKPATPTPAATPTGTGKKH